MTGQEILGGLVFFVILAAVVRYVVRKKKNEKPGTATSHPLPRKDPRGDGIDP